MQQDTPTRWLVSLAGLGLAGLFDGVLLHRLLQWHHVLTDRMPAIGPRAHLRWDGLFDALMMMALAAALCGLQRRRDALQRLPGRALAGSALAGFGLWHIIDAVMLHWVLGLHRIRPLAQSPLAWDLGWLLAFGLLPLIIGLTLQATTGNEHRTGTAAARPRSQRFPSD